MPRIPVHDIGTVGINPDIPDHLLPPEVWSAGINIRFQDGNAERIRGEAQIFGTPTQEPVFLLPVPTASTVFWVYVSLTDAFAYNSTVHSEITPLAGDFTVTEFRDWNGGLLGGVPFLNNGADDPVYWPSISGGTRLTTLSNWPANTKCKILRPFRNFLFALNITESGNTFPHRVKWSHSADPGTLPNSWDDTDPTKDTGETDLSDVISGVIVDAQQLRDRLVIYKENSTWLCSFVGGQFIFQFNNILANSGLLAPRCVTPVLRGTANFLHNGDDIVVFNGQTAQSILDKRMRRFLANNIDPTNFANSFAFTNSQQNEAWFCFPITGTEFPSVALIWNFEENTLSLREFSAVHAAVGPIETTSAETWTTVTDTWATINSPWSENTLGKVVLADKENVKLYQLDSGRTFDGAVYGSFIQRTGLAVVGKDRRGQPKVDIGSRKIWRRIWPKITGGPVNIRLGAQEDLKGTVTWSTAQSFDPAAGDRYLDFLINGRLLAVEIASVPGNDADWRLEGYDIEMEVLGEH